MLELQIEYSATTPNAHEKAVADDDFSAITLRELEGVIVQLDRKDAALRFRAELIRASVARANERAAYWRRLFIEARARIHMQERQAKADARRKCDVARKRQQRAGEITDKRIAALERVTANHGGDHRLVKLKPYVRELANFREALTEARNWYGPRASLTEIAATYRRMTGAVMGKDQARNRLRNVGNLERPAGAWYRWRNL
ncbi:hypothetical protein [Bradyrhizobium mercantei]|uniref:hypothetical protein n=1 Tax=Bradyrhizobium mercantei TaxID=1904807 RepID=UPI000977713B|nr:hypothetical protein [Bradyrhizobium mercantei]